MTQESHSWASIQTKTFIEKDTFTHMFTEALFTIAKTGKQSKCPSTDERIKIKWYIYIHTHTHTHTHTVEYNSAIKKNKIMPLAAT